jgi:hypothetical protein
MLPTESQRRMTEPRGSIDGRDMLRQLMKLQDTAAIIVKISPKDYRLSNGLDYCCVIVEYKDGSNYSLHEYGKGARKLFINANLIQYPISNS